MWERQSQRPSGMGATAAKKEYDRKRACCTTPPEHNWRNAPLGATIDCTLIKDSGDSCIELVLCKTASEGLAASSLSDEHNSLVSSSWSTPASRSRTNQTRFEYRNSKGKKRKLRGTSAKKRKFGL